MEQHNHLHTDRQPQVVLSQPAKAAVTVEAPEVSAVLTAKKTPTVPPLPPRKGKKGQRLLKALGLLALMFCVSLASVHAYISLTGVTDDSAAISGVYQQALPSVVLISSEFPGQTPDSQTDSGTGTGVILDSKGIIVTNAHVVQDATNIRVTLHSGKEYQAQLLGLDENTDLAALKINATELKAAKLAHPTRMWQLKVGDTAIVIGNPLGAELADTLTTGVISAIDRGVEVGSSIVEMLQTDASVSPGNSGGPIFDRNGAVIGIITSKIVEEGAEGLAFAVPADLAADVIDQLITYGYVAKRPMMGITVQSMDQATVDYYKDTYGEVYQVGIIVKEINQGNNAWNAGLRVGDKILEFDGFEVKTVNQVNYLKEQHSIGDSVTMVIEREGQQITLTFQLEGAK